jgi:peptidyl-prolyl cis-trans isomerase D
MLQFFRKAISTKLGALIGLMFLGLIALAFAASDVSTGGTFGGVAGGDRVATVGDDRIDTADLQRMVTNVVDNMRRENPDLTMRGFLEGGRLDELIDFMIDNVAALEFGKSVGMHVGNRLVDSEIAKIPGVQGPDGKVDEALYQRIIAQAGVSDAQYREGLEQELISNILLSSNKLGVRTPQKVVLRYASVVTERRKGAIALLPSAAFAHAAPPSDAEIKAWYDSHPADYQLPERRAVRFAQFDESVVRNTPPPSEAEIAARYKAEGKKYAPSDKRKLAQMVLPTEAAAKAVQAEIAAGKSLEAAAAAKGLGVAQLGVLDREEYALQSSAAAASAVFAAPNGALVGPFKAPLGWLLVRIEASERNPGKSLDQARAEIATRLGAEKRRAALTDFSARIEEEFDNGATLTDVAKELGLTLTSTEPLLANGAVFAKPGQTAPAVLGRVLQTAFSMEGEGQPQLAEIETGKTFMIFDVSQIQTAAPPPLAEIKPIVAEDARLAKGAKLAEQAAKKVEAQIAKGVPIEVAMASLGVALPPVDRVDQQRQQIQALGANAPPPLARIFTMPKGKVRLLAAPRNRGWYVITVFEVTPGLVEPTDPRLVGLNQTLRTANSSELDAQLRRAMRDEVGAKRNDAAIAAVRKRLLGGN